MSTRRASRNWILTSLVVVSASLLLSMAIGVFMALMPEPTQLDRYTQQMPAKFAKDQLDVFRALIGPPPPMQVRREINVARFHARGRLRISAESTHAMAGSPSNQCMVIERRFGWPWHTLKQSEILYFPAGTTLNTIVLPRHDPPTLYAGATIATSVRSRYRIDATPLAKSTAILAVPILVLIAWADAARHEKRSRAGKCPWCGYAIEGDTRVGTCSECGRKFHLLRTDDVNG